MLSVLMPVFNVEKYLEKTLDSVANQTYKDFEVVMIDDGSTDSSGKICDEYCVKDSRFRVIHCPNGGVSRVRNRCLDEAKGEYLFFMDSDDLILPETFEELIALRAEHDADMASGNIFYTDNEGNPLDYLNLSSPVKSEIITGKDYIRKLCEPNSNFYCTVWNKVYKKEVFDGIRFPVGRINEDEAVIHEIAYNCKKIAMSSKCYYNYIKHSASITGSKFGLKNLDRDRAFVDRIRFLAEHDMQELASISAMAALDAAISTFAKCVSGGLYYGKVKDRIHGFFAFEYPYAVKYKNKSLHERKILTVSAVILHCPEFYAKYVGFMNEVGNKGFGEAFKQELYDFIMKCFAKLPTKSRIVFESHPEMSCNTYPVYRYLLEKGLNEKYEFVWLTEDKSRYKDFSEKNVSFLHYSKNAKGIGEKLKYMYTVATAKALVYSNQLLGVYGKDRISLCLEHGMPLKKSNGTYCIRNKCTASLCETEFFADKFSEDFCVDKEKMIFMGFPRNDELFDSRGAAEKFGLGKYDKVVFWLPTFRQRSGEAKNKKIDGFEMSVHGTGIPSVETKEDLLRVNDWLEKNNCLVILKPHPVQNIAAMTETGMSNFMIISDETLRQKDVQLYELLGCCDALITDYSSVYYDYLLTDKPIGLTVGDIGEYIKKRGFVYSDPFEVLKGEHILDTDSLLVFLDNVKNGDDPCRKERTDVKKMIHGDMSGSSAEKVGEYLLERL